MNFIKCYRNERTATYSFLRDLDAMNDTQQASLKINMTQKIVATPKNTIYYCGKARLDKLLLGLDRLDTKVING